MEKKPKISVRKIMQVLVTLVVTVVCVIAISGASNKEIKRNLTGLDVHIKNNRHRFVDEQQIRDILRAAYGPDITSVSLNQLDTRMIERTIGKNRWVAGAQVYVDNKRMLHISVTQRVPVARIFEENGDSYYIDGSMSTMPVSNRYVYYTTVVTGVPNVTNDSIRKSLLGQVAYMVKHIEGDTFWNAQVSQIIMSADRTFEIVPVLGNQRILLGDTAMLEEKLGNLFVFYKKVMNRIGWDRYDLLDLRYKGQVVASPALQWKPPTDKSMNELKWVETIKDKAAYNKNTFSVDSNNVATVTKQAAPLAVVAPVTLPKPVVTVNAGATPKKVVEKPKQAGKPAVKIGPMPDVYSAPVPARKPADKKPVTTKTAAVKKVSAGPVAKQKIATAAAKSPVKKPAKNVVKKTTEKQPVKAKAADKQKDNKQEKSKQKEGKYIYQRNNNH